MIPVQDGNAPSPMMAFFQFQAAGFKWVRTLSPDNPVSVMELVRA